MSTKPYPLLHRILSSSEVTWQEVWQSMKDNHSGEISTKASPWLKKAVEGYRFTLKSIPVSSLNYGEWDPSLPMGEGAGINKNHVEGNDDTYSTDEKWARKFADRSPESAPPIIVIGQEILDGRHRSRAAFLRGDQNILAYVRIPT